jgi:hypothetical protein
MIRHVRAQGHGEQLHCAADIFPVPDRREFHQRVRRCAARQASGQAGHPARGKRRPDARGYRAFGQILGDFHRLGQGSEEDSRRILR